MKIFFSLFLFYSTLTGFGQTNSNKEITIPCSNYETNKTTTRALGIGNSRDLSMSRMKAVMNSKTIIAGLIKTKVTSSLDMKSTNSDEDFTQIVKQTINETLKNIKIICQKTIQNNSGGFTSYAAIEIEKVEEIIIARINKKNSTRKFYGTITRKNDTENSLSGDINSDKFYGLLIGVQNYNDKNINTLNHPIEDTSKLYNVLVNNYTFNPENLKILKNPTKNEITNQLDLLANKLNNNDNLLIFYAGHGFWDKSFEQGYWLPSDSKKDMRGTYISNSTIRDYLKGIQSRNILLITDACFAGGIFKTRSAFTKSSTAINELYKKITRVAITSGAMAEVPDKSVFLEYLIKYLKDNNKAYLPSEQLFSNIKTTVINNSIVNQIPQYGIVHKAGDEGGDFIFIKKQ